MGCDIHVMVEARTRPFGSEAWFNVDNWRHNSYHGHDNEPAMDVLPIYRDRNYELFSFLAGVRNYGDNPSFGFDRGFPDDASTPTASEYAGWGMDAHTPGYATLAELKEKIAAVGKVNRKGFVHKDQVAHFKKTGETPTSWCQGVGNTIAGQYEWMEWQDEIHCFDRLLAALEERKRDVFWIFDPNKDNGEKDADIRIVFWFDN